MKVKTLIDKLNCNYVLFKDGNVIHREYNCNYLEEKVISIDWWKEEEKLIIYLKPTINII